MNIPKLRFPEFTDEWEMKTLGEIFERVTRKNKEKNSNTLTFSAHQGLINQRIYYTKDIASKDTSHYYLLHKGDFAYNKGWCEGYPYGAIKRLKYYEKGVLSTLYICFSLKDKNENSEYFFEYFFDTDRINRYLYNIVTEGARNHGLLNVAINDFFEKIYVSYPCLEEQQLIGDFFSVIDKKISLLEEKKRLLTLYKKGIMQQIFSQEIRFKDENNNPFPDWEMKKLGEVFNISAGGDIEKEHVNKEKTNIFQYPIFANSEKNKGLYGYSDIYKIDGEVITVTGRGNLGIANARNEKFYPIVRLLVLKPKDKIKISIHFFENVINKINFLSESTGVPQLTAPSVAKFKISLPSLPEQKLIGEFLGMIDQKILLATQELESIQAYKKGLLQQMFV